MPKFERCPIPGCIFQLTDDYLVCWRHSLQIWERVQTRHLESAGDAISTPPAEDLVAKRAEERKRRTKVSLTPGVIYILALDEKIKVGWTSNLEQRMQSYPPHSRLLIWFDGTRADERDLHRTLRQSLVAGREWYSRTPQVLEFIRDAQLQRDRKYAEEAAIREEARRKASQARPAPRPMKPRPLRGGALVRAILDGSVT